MINNLRYQFDQHLSKTYHAQYVSGSDEVGRGAMAGPIVVASVILPATYTNPLIRDSKQLTPLQRTQLYDEIVAHALSFALVEIDAAQVDRLNPKQASILGIKKSLQQLHIKPDLALIDAETITLSGYHCVSFIKGDDKSQVIGAASILAKVHRDRLMTEYAHKYPQYQFAQHKGYCTRLHKQLLEQYGACAIHRLSYKPVKIIHHE